MFSEYKGSVGAAYYYLELLLAISPVILDMAALSIIRGGFDMMLRAWTRFI
jgi:hypothetical protein